MTKKQENKRVKIVSDLPAVAIDGSIVNIVGDKTVNLRFLQRVGDEEDVISAIVVSNIRMDMPSVEILRNMLSSVLSRQSENLSPEIKDKDSKSEIKDKK